MTPFQLIAAGCGCCLFTMLVASVGVMWLILHPPAYTADTLFILGGLLFTALNFGSISAELLREAVARGGEEKDGNP